MGPRLRELVPAAGGRQEAGFTQPRAALPLAHPCMSVPLSRLRFLIVRVMFRNPTTFPVPPSHLLILSPPPRLHSLLGVFIVHGAAGCSRTNFAPSRAVSNALDSSKDKLAIWPAPLIIAHQAARGPGARPQGRAEAGQPGRGLTR